ncbi:hypothetical protein BDW72DRAFT_177791 [Aspergillus terricola var. indicus]
MSTVQIPTFKPSCNPSYPTHGQRSASPAVRKTFPPKYATDTRFQGSRFLSACIWSLASRRP